MTKINSQQEQKINVRIEQGLKGISNFGKHWNDLFARADDAPPYLSHTWVKTFVEEKKIPGNPVFVLAFSGPVLVGLLPLSIRKCLNVKIAEPIGVGEASYLGVLHDQEYPSVVECIAEYINSEKIFDVYLNTFLSTKDKAVNDLLAALMHKGYLARQIHRDPCHCIQLGSSFDEYFSKCISSKSRHTLRRKERRLLRDYDVKFQCYTGKQVTSEKMTRIATVQEESWMKRRGVAVLNQVFYRKLLQQMAEAGLGCLWLMTIDGADAAFQYAFVAHKRLYLRWTAFKLNYKSNSPGQSLMMHILREACNDNILSIDIGPGDAEYKRFWATNHFDVNRVVAGKGLMGRLITVFCYSIWRMAKIRRFHTSYRRVKGILKRFKQNAPEQ